MWSIEYEEYDSKSEIERKEKLRQTKKAQQSFQRNRLKRKKRK